MLGRTCIPMLSASLQLHSKTWEDELEIAWPDGERKNAFKKGIVPGYKTCFGTLLNLHWDDCPADFDLLEQIVIARNLDQHPDNIATMSVSHTYKDRKRFQDLFFVKEADKRMYSNSELEGITWINPSVYVSGDGLTRVIDDVEKLAEWLEERILAFRYPG
jgi:hypothetical protein